MHVEEVENAQLESIDCSRTCRFLLTRTTCDKIRHFREGRPIIIWPVHFFSKLGNSLLHGYRLIVTDPPYIKPIIVQRVDVFHFSDDGEKQLGLLNIGVITTAEECLSTAWWLDYRRMSSPDHGPNIRGATHQFLWPVHLWYILSIWFVIIVKVSNKNIYNLNHY